MSSPDLEALVTPKINATIRAALEKVGRKEFLTIAGIDDQRLQEILQNQEEYIGVTLVTLACQINKSHGDPDPNHFSVTECLKGTIIRMAQTSPSKDYSKTPTQTKLAIRKLTKPRRVASINQGKSLQLLGFSGSTLVFLITGYFLGGIALSPVLGQPSCTGASVSPPSLNPCTGSIIGIIIGAIASLGYTYYYFVRKVST